MQGQFIPAGYQPRIPGQVYNLRYGAVKGR